MALDTPIGEVFSAGLIEVVISCIKRQVVEIGVEAPPSFLVLRHEITPPVLAQKLMTLRFIKQLSREDLARISGVSVNTLKQAETLGSPIGLDEVEALARGLGISVTELLKPLGATAQERVVLAMLELGE